MCSKSAFLILTIFKDIKLQFSKANLGHLDNFFGGMPESKLALNNLNFKCYIQGFLSDRSFGRKILWALSAPSQSFMFGQECRHLRVNHVVNKM